MIRDGEAVYREARARGYDGDRIVVIGDSLGTGIATVLTSTRQTAALVLDSPFSSAVDVAAAHYRMLPVRWLMFDQFRSDLAICDVHIKVLIVHSDADRIINMFGKAAVRMRKPTQGIRRGWRWTPRTRITRSAACRNPAAARELKRLAQDTEGKLSVFAMDVTDAKGIRNAAIQLKDVVIDALINSAGILARRGKRPAVSTTNLGLMS